MSYNHTPLSCIQDKIFHSPYFSETSQMTQDTSHEIHASNIVFSALIQTALQSILGNFVLSPSLFFSSMFVLFHATKLGLREAGVSPSGLTSRPETNYWRSSSFSFLYWAWILRFTSFVGLGARLPWSSVEVEVDFASLHRRSFERFVVIRRLLIGLCSCQHLTCWMCLRVFG